MCAIDAVVKVGGSLLRIPASYQAAVRSIAGAASAYHLVVVPGGGPLADIVRCLDQSLSLGSDTAHWLAIRAMDTHAELLAGCLPEAMLVETSDDVSRALAAGRVPVLAPSRWLRDRDPLPHSWDVTSDSIAAWMAGELRAPRLVLLKPLAGNIKKLADPYFSRALPHGVLATVVSVADLDSGGLDRELHALVPTEQ